ncbi:Heme oxygenase [Modestobacter sp. DSM 44400]|uniref:biliverdin-producing heme oxygenase n=1 Tax=Modestobacter sp. DSM 44400 TaxID=1550230 RepID=UPI00089C94E1|nr:biliverdin-producing heme oxygenase [Modestobacter sp. DSM 44400]SDY37371.1 Heme oxygenase [Modestobacter sp. DSM 44400]
MADDGDVLRRLRTDTAAEHHAVESTLGLLDPALTRVRLVAVLTVMHGFWWAAEAGLDAWADADPAAAAGLAWSQRRRAHLFAGDLAALGAAPSSAPDRPELLPVPGTDDALGRLYVLEGSTLGGVFIDRHLAALPQLADAAPLHAFAPYGERTGAMWHAYRTATRGWVAAGGDAARVVTAAQQTFSALAAWCGATVREPTVPIHRRGTSPAMMEVRA